MNKTLTMLALAGVMVGCSPNKSADKSNTAVSTMIWKDNKAEMDKFIDDLMGNMTIEEKIGQMTQLTSGWDVTGPTINENFEQLVKSGRVGSFLNAFSAAYTKKLQKMAVEETRLGIPLIFGHDVIHGHQTIFPISLGESASWDLDAIKTSARVAATEASAQGIHWTFAPMVDIARDPRWGRISEGAGEDVYLGSRIAEARVKGFQGDNLKDLNTIVACAKHFAAYGQAQAGRDYHTTNMSDRELRDVYLPPFKAAIDAGVGTFMTAFNELNGVPATGNEYLFDEILRKEWGFEGFVVTDYTAINELVPHGYAKDEKQAGELALNAGVDMDMVGRVYDQNLKTSLEEGKVNEQQIDLAVRRILEMKYRLGLFEDPYRYSDEEREKKTILSKEHRDAARDVARKSMVLLKNESETLPLKKTGSIALIGPLADSRPDMHGSWASAGGGWKNRTTVPVSLKEGIENVAGNVKINYAKGCGYGLGETDKSGFAAAIKAAKQSDVIVLAMGEAQEQTGEATSRTEITLPGVQSELLLELKKLNKPMVLVLMNGRPLEMEKENEAVDAVLETWFAGTEGGNAIADVLFGDHNPSGKLPVTFPRKLGQVPIYYNMKNTGRPLGLQGHNDPANKYRSKYMDAPNTPLYAFGHGLSYTTFEYSDVRLDKTTLGMNDKITVSVEVTNSGKYDGAEVVQLYVRDLVGSVTRPVKELKGFEKIFLKKGETKTVTFEIKTEDLAFHRKDMSYGVEEGDFQVFVGTSSDNVKESSFKLTQSGAIARR
ncbi:glycoside hydrolase family 3 N-terminal domain-containing protein [Limibacter armeniacum]|uniref:glycoside hydrolase family 3 N-terminal domain-containing protein n=1 Tax=Limibacter armeniacum TaxID=466084 RepID=UPI002FE54BE0